MLYACAYAEEAAEDEYLYIGYNFSVSSQELALPALPRDYRWHCILNTGEGNLVSGGSGPVSQASAVTERLLPENARSFLMERQSVCLLAGGREKKEGRK